VTKLFVFSWAHNTEDIPFYLFPKWKTTSKIAHGLLHFGIRAKGADASRLLRLQML
jgi:hypothetical protein